MKLKVKLDGERFGRLSVVGIAEKPPNSKNRHSRWLCRCDCGNMVVVASDKLTNGNTKSCGCLRLEVSTEKIKKYGKPHITHGKSKDRLYNIYNHMKARCYNAKNRKYKDYGGRGITICEEWRNSFEAFHTWAMANGYSDDLTIDRINVNGNYCPGNCRWATQKEQQNNKRMNHKVVYCGEEVTLAQLSEKTGVPMGTLWWRVKHGWKDEQLSKPVRKKGTKK